MAESATPPGPNLRAAYTLLTAAPAGAVPGTSAARRYRIALSVNATNLTNHANYGGYSGVMTSSFFMRPAFVLNPRHVDVAMNFGF